MYDWVVEKNLVSKVIHNQNTQKNIISYSFSIILSFDYMDLIVCGNNC
jgi:hypothetical protein